MFSRALESLDETAPKHRGAIAHVLSRLAHHRRWQGAEDATSLAKRAVELMRLEGDSIGLVGVLPDSVDLVTDPAEAVAVMREVSRAGQGGRQSERHWGVSVADPHVRAEPVERA